MTGHQHGQPGSEDAARLAAVMEQATAAVLALIRETGWPIQPGQVPVPWDITHGWCVDWAEFVCARVPGAVMAEHDDGDMLHTFVVYAGRFYDAETPAGVRAVTRLPVFTSPAPPRPVAAQ